MAIGRRCTPAPVISIESCANPDPALRQKITASRKRMLLSVLRSEG
jgi:hypothetical protein